VADSIPDATGFSYDDLGSALAEIHAECVPPPAGHIHTTDENKRLFQLAADHGINPRDYASLAECIQAIRALDAEDGPC
jgi:hypothetical protein